MLSQFLKKLLFVRQLIMLDGKVQILGFDQVILPAEFIKVISTSRNIYYDLKDVSERKMEEYVKKIGATQEELLENLVNIFETFGLGKLEISEIKEKSKEAKIRIHNSTLAVSYSKKSKTVKPVCDITSAILAGMFSFYFKKKVNATEKICTGQGKEFCEFFIG